MVPKAAATAKAGRSFFTFPSLLCDIEPHALRERKLRPEIDRVGGATHVSLPGIGAGLAAAAGLLLAPKGAADLRSRRPDVHVGDAAVRPGCGYEALGLAHVEGEDGRGEACADGVVQANCRIELGVAHHVENRRKGFAQDRTALLWHLAERGTHVISIPARDLLDAFAAMDVAASRPRLLERPLHALEGARVDERTDQSFRRARIADLHARIDLGQPAHQAVIDVVLHEQPSQRRTGAARGAGRRPRTRIRTPPRRSRPVPPPDS